MVELLISLAMDRDFSHPLEIHPNDDMCSNSQLAEGDRKNRRDRAGYRDNISSLVW